MVKYLLTYEDAREIAKRYKNSNFREFQYTINGYKVAAFDYFICGWDDFENPLPDRPEVDAFDMRGTTFVFDKDGKVWRRFFMLPKFFNINQVEATQYGNVKDKTILDATEKEDGSLVAFMMLPNDRIFAKTIGSFVSEQAQMAYNFLYAWEEKVEFVKMVLNAGWTPLFEYVSGPNRIVLKYSKEDLRFLGLRDNHNGEWIPACEIINTPFNTPEFEKNPDLDDLIRRAKIEEDKEGWVVRFPDGLMKIKTEWYFNLHGLRTENVFRADYVIRNYLEKTLDDLMSQLDRKEDSDAFAFVDDVTNAVDNYIAHVDKSVFELKEKFKGEYFSEWVSFAKDYHKAPYFGLARNLVETPEDYNRRKIEMILKKTYRLKNAEQFVEKWKN